MTEVGESLFVVAIDIGSEYSGHIFSDRTSITCKPPIISFIAWPGKYVLTCKCKTAILLDRNGEMVAFGYEAERKFSELLEDDEHRHYFYFEHFRNDLHQREEGNSMITDVRGKPLEALKVISQTIGYFKHDAINKIKNRHMNPISDEAFYFVLTVPATWDDKEKDFMKKAAIMAGITENKLGFVVETDAASMFILRADSSLSDVENRIQKGETYMVIDLGGSFKSTYRRINVAGSIEETHASSKGPLTGKSIDEAFYKFLCEIFGKEIMESFKTKEYGDSIDFFEVFETKKRSIHNKDTKDVEITLPLSLIVSIQKKHTSVEKAIEKSPFKGTVSYSSRKLRVSSTTFKGIFEPTIRAIIKHIETMQKNSEVKAIKIIMIHGGFSECLLMQDAMIAFFGNSKDVLIPEEGTMAVLKGAVLFAFEPKEETKIAELTYGNKEPYTEMIYEQFMAFPDHFSSMIHLDSPIDGPEELSLATISPPPSLATCIDPDPASASGMSNAISSSPLSTRGEKCLDLCAYDRSGKIGYLLIINFMFSGSEREREGSEEDVGKLCKFFTNLKYDVDCRVDLTTEDLRTCLENVRHNYLSRESSKYYCFICVIMSHGNERGICTIDSSIEIDEIVNYFKNDQLKKFIGKPKVFMVQSCRGDTIQQKQKYESFPEMVKHDNSNPSKRLPTEADILKIYATTPGHVAHRTIGSQTWNGSWLIHAFLETAKKRPRLHVDEMMTLVRHQLSNDPAYEYHGKKCQIAVSETTLTKLFYL